MRSSARVRRLLRIYDQTNEEQRRQGRAWYTEANAFAGDLERAHQLPRGAGAGIIAALSPRTPWPRNKDLARKLAAGEHVLCLPRSREQATRIRNGAPAGRVLNGPKTRAFAACIRRPRGTLAVAVDVWAARAARVDPDQLKSRRTYQEIASIYRRAARLRNERPSDFQAIIWIAVRGKAA